MRSITPPPAEMTHEAVERLVAVHFSTEQDALHAAALVLRGGQHVWLIEGDGLRLTAPEIRARCRKTLEMFEKR
jgi:hypothetical protein